jgi:hypothetical protein
LPVSGNITALPFSGMMMIGVSVASRGVDPIGAPSGSEKT